MKEIKEEISVISEGTQSTLRNQLLTCFYKCSEKKYRTENDTMNFTDMYESYHKLKGNSFIDKDIKPHFYNLPLKRDPHITYKTKNIGRITKVKKSKKEVCSDEK